MNNQAILCVDDERIILMSLRDQLSEHFGDRYRYEFAESAAEAWEIIDELGDDGVALLVIVSDWLMPGVRGDEFLIDLHQRFPQVIKVMLTGQADEAAIARAKTEADLYCTLAKPWDKSSLIAALETALLA